MSELRFAIPMTHPCTRQDRHGCIYQGQHHAECRDLLEMKGGDPKSAYAVDYLDLESGVVVNLIG